MTKDISNLHAEIAKAKKQAAAKIAKLKRDAAAEQRKVDLKVVELLREQQPDLCTRLAGDAASALAAERDMRARRARRASLAASDPETVPYGGEF